MVESIARVLGVLHRSGRVHRDLKPENVLYLLQSTDWRLLDLGIATNIGAHQRLPGWLHCNRDSIVWRRPCCHLDCTASRAEVVTCAPGQPSTPIVVPPACNV
jgi:serine/threonine protein kinase